MLYYAGYDAEGNLYRLSSPVEVSIRSEIRVPCDRFSGKFLWREGLPELRYVMAARDAALGDRYFLGAVDEQAEVCSGEGHYCQISARSLAFLMDDNELPPTQIDSATPLILFYHFLRPLGINLQCEDMNVSAGRLVVRKGDSTWDLMEDYCRRVYDLPPRMQCSGSLWMGRYPMGLREPVVVGDSTGVFVSSFTKGKRRGEPISEVVILSPEDASELQRISHAPTVEQGIRRQVCLVAEDGLEVAVAEANVLLQKAAERSDRVEMTLLAAPPTDVGETLHLSDGTFGSMEGLLVTSIEYQMSDRGEWCHVGCVDGAGIE